MQRQIYKLITLPQLELTKTLIHISPGSISLKIQNGKFIESLTQEKPTFTFLETVLFYALYHFRHYIFSSQLSTTCSRNIQTFQSFLEGFLLYLKKVFRSQSKRVETSKMVLIEVPVDYGFIIKWNFEILGSVFGMKDNFQSMFINDNQPS